MKEWFNDTEKERIKDIADELKKRYNIEEDNFSQCLEFLFQVIEENNDGEILDKTWDIICPQNSRPEFISGLFDDYCRLHDCEDCRYARYSDKIACRVAFTLDYVKDNKDLFEGD